MKNPKTKRTPKGAEPNAALVALAQRLADLERRLHLLETRLATLEQRERCIPRPLIPRPVEPWAPWLPAPIRKWL